MFGNQQGLLQQNWGYRYPIPPAQYGAGNFPPRFGQGMNQFMPNLRGQGNFLMPQGLGQIGSGAPGLNTNWRPMPQSIGGQGYAAPGYPSRVPQLLQPQPQMPMTQGYPSQGFPLQNYPPQGYNPGYGDQKPVQPAWEEPKKGGIKGFISNLMAKRKR